MLNFFIRKLPNSAISNYRTGRRTNDNQLNHSPEIEQTEYLTSILNNASQSVLMMELYSVQINNPNDCCKEYCAELFDLTDIVAVATVQQSKEWYEQRQFRITGSRIYELYTYSGQDWETKSLKYFYPKSFTNKFVKHGIKFESEAREVFAAETGLEVVECGMVISGSNPWLGYSPGGIIMEEGKPVALLEIKCLYEGSSKTITEAIKKATFVRKGNGQYFLKDKHKYYGQVQLGMGLLNVDKCYLSSIPLLTDP